jgi:hypothetical protein
MHKTKLLEVRDRATLIPVAAVKLDPLNPEDAGLLNYAGWAPGSAPVYIFDLAAEFVAYDPYKVHDGSRTRQIAYKFIRDHFDELASGQVVDVRFILGEAPAPALPEAVAW